MPQLEIVPVTLAEARAFITAHHRHHGPPVGHRVSLGVADAGRLVGVLVMGRPVGRMLDDGRTIEVTRSCTVGTPNANSMLYGAAWRAARAIGYRRLVTYTQEGESGASLRAAGLRIVSERAARPGWDTPARRRTARGTDDVRRYRWEVVA